MDVPSCFHAKLVIRLIRDYLDSAAWSQKAILNVARSGMFSSDRPIIEYNRDIGGAKPVTVDRE